ncbi:hypothetical protein GCM10010421_32060 [Streptomyces glaucus]|uniref:Secreted protein n=1 Tax=Streptomyces glaucus TaxID=284029 RepID=A0ABP5WXG1_9ACTN
MVPQARIASPHLRYITMRPAIHAAAAVTRTAGVAISAAMTSDSMRAEFARPRHKPQPSPTLPASPRRAPDQGREHCGPAPGAGEETVLWHDDGPARPTW